MDVIIIGAGASGLMAAITAANQGAKVTVIEHENKPGKKILVTGNGKCNITNTKMSGKSKTKKTGVKGKRNKGRYHKRRTICRGSGFRTI